MVNKEGYVVVNELQLDLALLVDPNARPLRIILCKKADREEMARRFYRLKSFEVVEETYQRQVKGLDAMQPATAITMDKLQQERDQAKAYAQKASEGLARRGSASVHHCAGKSAVVFGWTNRRWERSRRPHRQESSTDVTSSVRPIRSYGRQLRSKWAARMRNSGFEGKARQLMNI